MFVSRRGPRLQQRAFKLLESDSFYNASDTVSISGQVDRTKEVDGVKEVRVEEGGGGCRRKRK